MPLCPCRLKIYRKRKGEQFGRFHNDEDVICKQVSTIDDNIANAGEEIVDENFNTEKLDNMQVKLVSYSFINSGR